SGGSQPSIQRGRDGRLLFALAEGAASLVPERIQVNPAAPSVIIEELRVDGKPQEIAGPGEPRRAPASNESASLSLSPGRHVVEFRYTATSLVAPSKVRFRHQLKGVDLQWGEPEAARTATYSLTAPGNYRFQLRACNNDGVWNEAGTTIALAVAPWF